MKYMIKKSPSDAINKTELKKINNLNEIIDIAIKEGYIILSEYINSKSKILLKPPCGHDNFEMLVVNFKSGHRCPICARENATKTKTEKSKIEFEEMIMSEGYKLKSEFRGMGVNVTLETPCEHEDWLVRPQHFKTGGRCPKCARKKIGEEKRDKGESDFKKLLTTIKYKALTEYNGAFDKITLKCDKGHIFETIPSKISSGRRCTICSPKSKGEEFVVSYLKDRFINFEKEKTFKGLVGLGGGSLRFDFYLPEHNTIIEVQGEQHFEKSEFSGNTIEHDEIKRKFCSEKNINLVEVPYFSSIGVKKALKIIEDEMNKIVKTFNLSIF